MWWSREKAHSNWNRDQVFIDLPCWQHLFSFKTSENHFWEDHLGVKRRDILVTRVILFSSCPCLLFIFKKSGKKDLFHAIRHFEFYIKILFVINLYFSFNFFKWQSTLSFFFFHSFSLSFHLSFSPEKLTVLERDTCVVVLTQNVANNPKTVFLDNQNIATEIIHTLFDEAICKHSQAKCIFITQWKCFWKWSSL